MDRLVTMADLEALPEDGQLHELTAGMLLAEPAPFARHGAVAARILLLVGGYVDARGLGVVLGNDAGFLLASDPDTVRGPDVAFVARRRWEAAGELRGYFPGPPDLAIEVLSAETRESDVHAKVADYLSAGTPLVWVVDPDRRRVRVYRSLLAPRALGVHERLDGEDVLPGFSVAVEELFRI
ncbi:MAG TPA: Uma2 family endonuclease [Candidatus Polarisedimenticolaceae bacterium]|nr:Uma2 family endonuclease [Candidatus Polarisedimenticolaceae bacterium]